MKCTLVIKDEANCLFVGLDRDAGLVLAKKLTYHVPGARHTPRFRLGQWDGTVCLYKSGWAFTNLIDESMIGYLEGRGFEIEVDDQRRDVSHISFEPVTEDSLQAELPPEVHRMRDYQVAAINAALATKQGIFLMATNAGKTYVCAVIAKRYAQHGRVIVIVPRVDLVEQTAGVFIKAGVDAGMFYGSEKLVKDVIVSTWQSLSAYPEILEGVICVIGDECHTVKADVLSGLLTVAAKDVPFRFGFTGTLPKDALASARVKAALGDVVFTKESWELIRDGYSSSIHIHAKQLQEHRKEFLDYQDEYKFLTTDDRKLDYVAAYIASCAARGNTFVLVQHIETGKKLAAKIPGATFVSGSVKTKARKTEYGRMEGADGLVIIATAQIGSTGLDIPRIFHLVMIEPRKAFTEVIQTIGRGLRKVEGDKEHIDVHDLHSNTKYSKRHFRERKKFYEEAQYPMTLEKVSYL